MIHVLAGIQINGRHVRMNIGLFTCSCIVQQRTLYVCRTRPRSSRETDRGRFIVSLSMGDEEGEAAPVDPLVELEDKYAPLFAEKMVVRESLDRKSVV